MRILVTGGAGFMGSNFIRYILNKYPDYEIINLDKLTYAGNLDNLRDVQLNPRYRFCKGDIRDEYIVNSLMAQNIEAVINYAAETHVDRSILGPESFILTDVVGTYILLEAAKKYKVSRYIQISTDEVYGEIKKGRFYEESPFKPRSPYSASKAGGDHLVQAYYITYNLPTIRTHSCNFYGPYQYPEKLIPLFITNLIEGKKAPLYGKGNEIREWIYTQDHVRAIDLLLHKGQPGEVYNIGTGQERRNIEVTRAILKEIGQDEEMIEYVEDRPGHDFRYALDWLKLKSLGWEPEYKFEDGLKETIAWYKNHQWWWRAIKEGRHFKEYYQRQYQKMNHES